MAVTFTWYGLILDGVAKTIASGNAIGFYGNSLGGPVAVGGWNTNTNIATASGLYANSLNNTESGSVTFPVSAATVPLKVHVSFSDGPETINSARLHAYKLGSTDAPENMTLLAAEAGVGTGWHLVGGSTFFTLAAQDEAETYDYFIALTASPTAVGEHIGNRLVFSVTYGGIPT